MREAEGNLTGKLVLATTELEGVNAQLKALQECESANKAMLEELGAENMRLKAELAGKGGGEAVRDPLGSAVEGSAFEMKAAWTAEKAAMEEEQRRLQAALAEKSQLQDPIVTSTAAKELGLQKRLQESERLRQQMEEERQKAVLYEQTRANSRSQSQSPPSIKTSPPATSPVPARVQTTLAVSSPAVESPRTKEKCADLEDHISRLQDELLRQDASVQQAAALEGEVARLQAALAEKEQQLADTVPAGGSYTRTVTQLEQDLAATRKELRDTHEKAQFLATELKNKEVKPAHPQPTLGEKVLVYVQDQEKEVQETTVAPGKVPAGKDDKAELQQLRVALENMSALAQTREAEVAAANQHAAEREEKLLKQLSQKDDTIVELTKAGLTEREGARTQLENSVMRVTELQKQVDASKEVCDELDKHATAVQKLAWERESAVKDNLALLQKQNAEKDDEIGFLEAQLQAMPVETMVVEKEPAPVEKPKDDTETNVLIRALL